MSTATVPVVIIGAGPTGLTAATLLGQYGVECLVLDRWESIYPQPRAVHLDDEIYRILARIGLREEFAAISRPLAGAAPARPEHAHAGRVPAWHRRRASTATPRRTCSTSRSWRPSCARTSRSTPPSRPGQQPTSPTSPRTAPDRCGSRSPTGSTGVEETVTAEYVLGCDGANSLVRAVIGASPADLQLRTALARRRRRDRRDLGQWEGVHQVCDPVRAGYLHADRADPLPLGVPAGRRRDRRRLPRHRPAAPAVWPRGPGTCRWTGCEIGRVAEYTFRARLADRWRDRRVFLLGDAAHLTPPFIGQGLCAGIRDAANLAWKLAGVLAGDAARDRPGHLPGRTQAPRPALIRLAKLVGAAMTAGGELGNLLRRVLAPRMHLLPGVRDHILNSETPPLHRSGLVQRPPRRRSLAGRLCPNAPLGDGRRFDDVAAGRFALVTTDEPDTTQRAEVEQRGGVVVTAGAGSALHQWLRNGHARRRGRPPRRHRAPRRS